MPPSQTDRPGKLCPPPRTATGSPVSLREAHGGDHVRVAGAARDQGRGAVDRAVPDLPVLVVAGVAGTDQPPRKERSSARERGLVELVARRGGGRGDPAAAAVRAS